MDFRQRPARVTLTLPAEAAQRLSELAAGNYRDPRQEATRLLLEAIDRERPGQVVIVGRSR